MAKYNKNILKNNSIAISQLDAKSLIFNFNKRGGPEKQTALLCATLNFNFLTI